MTACSIDGCGRPAKARWLCRKHYLQQWRKGTIDTNSPMGQGRWPVRTVAERFWSHVDIRELDECWLWMGSKTPNGYGYFHVITYPPSEVKREGAHRMAYKLTHGDIPDELEIDHHWTCPKHCVNPDHLRLATHKQNNENRAGVRHGNQVGIRGVGITASGKYRARMCHNGIEYHLGSFNTPAEAEAAVIVKRLELFTHNDRDREGGNT